MTAHKDRIEQSGRELVLRVPDMDCLTCARRISDRLHGISGIDSVDAHVVTRDIRVAFDPGRVREGDIEQAVRGLGYGIERDGHSERESSLPSSVWRGVEARRTYISGALIGAGLLLRLLGLEPVLWSAATWSLDPAALFFTAAALIGGYNFFPKGIRAAWSLRLDMNFLMTAAIFGALGIGEFFEAGTIAALFGIAELLEDYSVERARRSLRELLDLRPAIARVRRDDEVASVPVAELDIGDRVIVRPGEKVPIDGRVADGVSSVDQSPITGESVPVTKTVTEYVYAGSMNQEGYLEVEVDRRSDDTALAHIIHLVEEAESSRAPSERFVEAFARYYTPAVTGLAIAVMAVPPIVLGAPFDTWFLRGLTLLVISCPCALVISTPVAVVSGITSAARNGVLIKGGNFLEAVGRVRVVAFDKTGTLTSGRLEVVDVIASDESGGAADDVIGLAAAVESRSSHPVAAAIRREADRRLDGRRHDDGAGDRMVSDFEAQAGRGVRARVDDTIYRVGRPELFGATAERWRSAFLELGAAGRTPICVGTEREVLGVIAVADRARPDAHSTVEALRDLGIERIVMLTGDHDATARSVAGELGIDEHYSGLLPDQKVDLIRKLEDELGPVAMVGDGVNDAPALATASVGIAMGAAASDAALETADVALMADDLSRLPYLFKLSRRSGTVIRQNIAASIGIKLSLAAGVFPGWVSLITAVLAGDMGASLGVIANALRLGRVRG